jgi:hypothetical protein
VTISPLRFGTDYCVLAAGVEVKQETVMVNRYDMCIRENLEELA